MDERYNKSVKWRCPSNIAIVKYWGKKNHQIPCNSSVSMTLSKAVTEVELSFSAKKSQESIELEYYFEGKINETFQTRISNYLGGNAERFPFLKDYAIRVQSANTFPHSTGIASSASAFGAIALALSDVGQGTPGVPFKAAFYQHASELARLGSGSACRSVYGGFAMWGSHPAIPEASDHFAVKINRVHDNFKDMQDAILIVDDQPKKVSSSLGHDLMKGHRFAENRFLQAQTHTEGIINTLGNGDYEKFIQIAESEALALHAMMMTSENYYLLMKPGTIRAIEKIIHFREETHTPVCFTLDAGPNVHVLYPGSYRDIMAEFIREELKPEVKEIIFDQTGTGPEKIY